MADDVEDKRLNPTSTPGDLCVWWVPQIPGRPFFVPVPDARTGRLVCDALAAYDLFQLEHGIRPEFSNAGGIVQCEDSMELDPGDWPAAVDANGDELWPVYYYDEEED